MQQSMSAERGPIRDALTLFDECGVVVVGDQEATLRTMAARDWRSLFQAHREGWQNHLRVFIVGHALLEKFMQPYKAITAQALMYRAPPEFMKSDRLAQRTYVDALMAEQLAAGMLLRSSAELSPLPLMGIPGWWAEGPQDDGFYADEKVFRPAPNFFKPATVLYLDSRRAFGGLE
jgi:hypothetical protein